MAALDAVIAAIQEDIEALGDLYVPETPPDNLSDFEMPAMLIYSGGGYWRLGTADDGTGHATRWGSHTIHVDYHLNLTDMPVNIAAAMPLADAIPNALMAGFAADRFDETVKTLGDPNQRGTPPIRYELMAMKWGGRETIGWRFQMDVTTEEQITG